MRNIGDQSISRKQLFVLLGLALLVAIMGPFIFMLWMDRRYFHSKPYQRKGDQQSDALVRYYSRSGNTEAMAREIARKYQADIVKLHADAYPLDVRGWLKSGSDARNKKLTAIKPQTIDLSPYKLIILGSPIWLFRPAPPLWTFVARNNFQGKSVVLFNTFNSRFKSREINHFRELIAKKGGRLVDHFHIRRGRIYSQMSGRRLIAETRKLLQAPSINWLRSAKRLMAFAPLG